jgi:hypothetical protein
VRRRREPSAVFQEFTGIFDRAEQGFDALAQGGVVPASGAQESGARFGCGLFQRLGEQGFFGRWIVQTHRVTVQQCAVCAPKGSSGDEKLLDSVAAPGAPAKARSARIPALAFPTVPASLCAVTIMAEEHESPPERKTTDERARMTGRERIHRSCAHVKAAAIGGPNRGGDAQAAPLKNYIACFLGLAVVTAPCAADWPQFRGPGGSGVSDAKGAPLQWSDAEGVLWKTDLPGPGASSPIVFGDRIFLTCYTGFGPGIPAGAMTALKRHLLCFDRATGRLLWNTPVPADLPEQERIREDHGYASSTPVADAGRVYVFFGKSGVFAFDHSGRQLWNTKVGTQLNGWGSAASPVLHKDFVLVNASVESRSLVALDKKSGQEVWRADGIGDSWHAPALVAAPDGKTEVVAAMSKRVLGFDADTGQELWRCDTGIYWYMCPTPVTRDGAVYLIGGRGPTVTMAIRAGGRGDVNASHVLWKRGKGSNVPSPALHDGHLYFAHENLGLVLCVNARTGDLVYEERLSPNPGMIYASPVLADGRLYYFGRTGRAAVVAAAPKFEQLANNTLEGGRGVFNASPAFDGRRLLVRSNRALYCLGQN